MPKPVTLPVLGPAIEEALLVKWLVPVGAFVKRGEPLFSVETDKTLTDCESVDEGYLLEITVEEGATVRIDQVLATLGEEAPASMTAAKAAPVAPAPSPVVTPTPSPVVTPAPPPVPALHASDREAPVVPLDARLRASPRARRIARESGVPIERVAGSGPDGRIVQRDVMSFVADAVAGRAEGFATAGPIARSGRSQEVPLSPMRRSIARRLTESAQAAPVFYTTVKIDADNIGSLRAQLARARSIDVSINDVIVRACALALREHRALNASFTEDAVRIHDDIDISVAVALDDGLITPIVRNADQKPLTAIAAETKTLVEKARAGALAVTEYQGGSFTISNLGMFGVDAFTAIINPPQCAILAVGAIDREVYLEAGAPRDRGVMRLTLTSDHRVIDGAQAARFLATLKGLLENPASVLI